MKAIATKRNRDLRIRHVGDARAVMFGHAVNANGIEHRVDRRHLKLKTHRAINRVRHQKVIAVGGLRRAGPALDLAAHIRARKQRRMQKSALS